MSDGGDCSCESRLGFAVSAAPEIVRRFKNHPHDRNMKSVVGKTLREITDIHAVYERLPMVDFDPVDLAERVKTT